MRILLDESLPIELADALRLPDIKTVAQLGLKGLENGELLRRAESLGFTVLLTADQGLPFQQHIPGYDLGVIVLTAATNSMEHLRPLIPSILQAIQLIAPGQVMRLGA